MPRDLALQYLMMMSYQWCIAVCFCAVSDDPAAAVLGALKLLKDAQMRWQCLSVCMFDAQALQNDIACFTNQILTACTCTGLTGVR